MTSRLRRESFPWSNDPNRRRQQLGRYYQYLGLGPGHTRYPATRSTLNKNQDEPRKQTVAAAGNIIPLYYGDVNISGMLGQAAQTNDFKKNWVIMLIWGLGEWESIDEFWIGEERAEDKFLSITNYMGTTTQEVDPLLQSLITNWNFPLVFTQNGISVGVCYSVLTLKSTFTEDPTNIKIVGKSKKLYDPRAGITQFSKNPGLMHADFESNPIYGKGLNIDWDSVTALADRCDEDLEGQPRITCNLGFLNNQDSDTISSILSTYADCFISLEGNTVKFIPDAPASSVMTITRNDIATDDKGKPLLEYELQDITDVPTAIKVYYSDLTKKPPGKPYVEFKRSDIDSGLIPRVDSTIDMLGFDNAQVASRFAIKRFNTYGGVDFTVTCTCFDKVGMLDKGDIVTLSFNPPIEIITTKEFRVFNKIPARIPGMFDLVLSEYNPIIYTDEVVEDPILVNTTLPTPIDPTRVVTELSINEALFQDQSGKTFSRLDITWRGVDWGYVQAYRVVVTGSSKTFYEAMITHIGEVIHRTVTAAVSQGTTYTVNVYVVSKVGSIGNPVSAQIIALGKLLPPSDVPVITGYEIGQFVMLQWELAIDIDLVGYRLKRGEVTDTWETAPILVTDRIDSDRTFEGSVPPGLHRYFIKALDSLSRPNTSDGESVNAAYVDVQVTADISGAITLNLFTILGGLTLLNMYAYSIRGVGNYVVTDHGDTLQDRFPGDLAASNYPDTLLSLNHSDSGGECSVETGEWDLMLERVGTWAFNTTIDLMERDDGNASRSFSVQLADETDYPTFTEHASRSVKQLGRYMKAKVEDTSNNGNASIRIKFPVQSTFKGESIEQSGTGVIPSGGFLNVVFPIPYTSPPDVDIELVGVATIFLVKDNVTATSFDAYSKDLATLNPIGCTFNWKSIGT